MAKSARSYHPIVQLSGASFTYGMPSDAESCASSNKETVQGKVSDISLQVKPGECFILCGGSGDGKSTVLRMIEGLAGTFFPGSLTGSIEVCGYDVLNWPARNRAECLGTVMQDPRSQFFMGTVFDEIAFTSENLGISPDEIHERVNRAAELTGVTNLLGEGLIRLSSGQKQRVALAAALAEQPKLLVLDEPTSNLDDEGAQTLVDILADLKQQGIALVISEHRLQRFASIADVYVCLCKGRAVAQWDAAELMSLSADEAACYGLRHPAMERDSARSAGSSQRQVPDRKNISPIAQTERAKSALTKAPGWSVCDLTYEYLSTKRGVRGVTAHFAAGAVTVISGPNGIGKTTLARVLCGALREQAGSVLRDGKPISHRDRRRSSYFVMQDADYQLYAGSVADEVVLGRKIDDNIRAHAKEALEAFDLLDVATCHPLSLSGGQKQRVTLAAAYCCNAELVVLDEPTSGLDGAGVMQVARWCRTLSATGKVVIIITHDRLLTNLAADAVVDLTACVIGKEDW